ncbi:MAG: GWxTD domain-containing protein [Ignavibacteria bacterium]|nr:GWxTD domain-containing protein [Ignavibacteria bacterium]
MKAISVLRSAVLAGLVAGWGAVHAQVEMGQSRADAGPTFHFDAIAYASNQPQKSRIEAYVQVSHEEIRFLKEGDYYVARYEVTLSIYTTAQQLVHERLWSVEVRVADFSQTTSNRVYNLTQRSLDVDPGTYQITVRVRDQESQKSAQIRRSLMVTDFAKDPLSLSDIMLVSRLTTDGERKTIVPIISGNVNRISDGFFVFFEAYAPPAIDTLDITWKILNLKKSEVFKRNEPEAVTGKRSQVFLKVDDLNLPMGSYFLTVDAVPAGDAAEAHRGLKATTSRTFTVRSIDLPVAILDLDKAIDQLIYIARESELSYIREEADDTERRKRFLEFWSKRDPDPQTPRNELMEEYYARVEYANQNFKSYVEGWRTDMGMVFIRFGPPENIERHPFELNSKPYEIWYYYQLNRQFIFVDESGFGDYRLRYPTTDLWGRVR